MITFLRAGPRGACEALATSEEVLQRANDDLSKAVEVLVRGAEGEVVPNIRILCAELLAKAADVADDTLVRMTIRPTLEALANDADADVAHYGANGLAKLG